MEVVITFVSVIFLKAVITFVTVIILKVVITFVTVILLKVVITFATVIILKVAIIFGHISSPQPVLGQSIVLSFRPVDLKQQYRRRLFFSTDIIRNLIQI
ncbi:hypothetical protein EVAR_97718_1 [Eumeta japonica]|uniref:Uncharacterized protein n=1 Tax=Eumeta variegata TaxID=151549 RepID=A0A4C1Y0J2_EUMVA|nr:hypothetical protein EVAR_97718_1 [Eumeta japonica]